ncbi:ECF RNA polymerase sigma-E factor [Kordia antarctica]|uniref:ECF RNA polymerase sigma-E factor n=1 Tax=Kordia antarctica TaxID=1218801 RepID=A0A7L4ZQV1_9FLAO|nr:sigma-70 family RNA polymerase sigma factor [Kordia antarctica]QHI38891.1 ECF RNA polymerase sigma-E factor [Kordia antarctica]
MNVVETTLIDDLKNPKTQEKAFRELVSTYKERLYWHIRRMVTSHEDTDDVLQNTFVKVFRSIDKFKGDSKLYSWMYRIATNESITFINQRAKKSGISSEELKDHLVNNLQADVYFEGDEIQLQLQKAIAILPQKQQLVFTMRYFDDIKYKDMSEILDTSVGALKASYHHAVKKIENYLTD